MNFSVIHPRLLPASFQHRSLMITIGAGNGRAHSLERRGRRQHPGSTHETAGFTAQVACSSDRHLKVQIYGTDLRLAPQDVEFPPFPRKLPSTPNKGLTPMVRIGIVGIGFMGMMKRKAGLFGNVLFSREK